MAPIEWEPADTEHWRIVERCGACELWRVVVISNARAALLDVRLDNQVAIIAHALQRLDRERMVAQVEMFTAALQQDLIGAADFAC